MSIKRWLQFLNFLKKEIRKIINVNIYIHTRCTILACMWLRPGEYGFNYTELRIYLWGCTTTAARRYHQMLLRPLNPLLYGGNSFMEGFCLMNSLVSHSTGL
jgi:hypothetical protein